MIPAAMVIVLVVVQACLWAHASTIVRLAADQGEQSACLAGGTLAAGSAAAHQVLEESGRAIITDGSVQDALGPNDTVTMRVSGNAISIVPWIGLSVSAVQIGSRQEFRVSG